jgi:AcrR family transcriptional regulator
MPKVSDAHKAAVRQGIVDAAWRVIERDGLAKLTTRAIIDEAGVSNGTLYHYFPSIDHLYAELAEAGLGDAMSRIVRAPVEPTAPDDQHELDAEEAVDRLMTWLGRDMLGDQELAAAIAGFRSRIQLGGDSQDAVEGLNRYVASEFGALVRRLQDAGGLRPELDGDALIEMIDLLWDGLGRRQPAGAFETSYERVVAVIVDVLLHGIRP